MPPHRRPHESGPNFFPHAPPYMTPIGEDVLVVVAARVIDFEEALDSKLGQRKICSSWSRPWNKPEISVSMSLAVAVRSFCSSLVS